MSESGLVLFKNDTDVVLKCCHVTALINELDGIYPDKLAKVTQITFNGWIGVQKKLKEILQLFPNMTDLVFRIGPMAYGTPFQGPDAAKPNIDNPLSENSIPCLPALAEREVKIVFMPWYGMDPQYPCDPPVDPLKFYESTHAWFLENVIQVVPAARWVVCREFVLRLDEERRNYLGELKKNLKINEMKVLFDRLLGEVKILEEKHDIALKAQCDATSHVITELKKATSHVHREKTAQARLDLAIAKAKNAESQAGVKVAELGLELADANDQINTLQRDCSSLRSVGSVRKGTIEDLRSRIAAYHDAKVPCAGV